MGTYWKRIWKLFQQTISTLTQQSTMSSCVSDKHVKEPIFSVMILISIEANWYLMISQVPKRGNKNNNYPEKSMSGFPGVPVQEEENSGLLTTTIPFSQKITFVQVDLLMFFRFFVSETFSSLGLFQDSLQLTNIRICCSKWTERRFHMTKRKRKKRCEVTIYLLPTYPSHEPRRPKASSFNEGIRFHISDILTWNLGNTSGTLLILGMLDHVSYVHIPWKT